MGPAGSRVALGRGRQAAGEQDAGRSASGAFPLMLRRTGMARKPERVPKSLREAIGSHCSRSLVRHAWGPEGGWLLPPGFLAAPV